MQTINMKELSVCVPCTKSRTIHGMGRSLSIDGNIAYHIDCCTQPLQSAIHLLMEQGQEWLKEKLSAVEALEKAAVKSTETAFEKWLEQAQEVHLLQLALQIINTKKPGHTSNEWKTDAHHDRKIERISNLVYSLDICYEERRSFRTSSVKWAIIWSFGFNSIESRNSRRMIAGSEKVFSDYGRAVKYAETIKDQYIPYFMEENPPVPKAGFECFSVNGVLLPGYRPEEEREAIREAS